MEPGVDLSVFGWFFENKTARPAPPEQLGSGYKTAKPDLGIRQT